ncbi:MAG: PEGA domain-containing protein [Acidobacteria bacterium]|nr:PEGA domain-containing protein [Acidobacteriota bacterium]
MRGISAAAVLMAAAFAAAPVDAGQHRRREGSRTVEPVERAVPREQTGARQAEPAQAPASRRRAEPRRTPEPPRADATRTPRQGEDARDQRRTPDGRVLERAVPRTGPYREPDSRLRPSRSVIVAPRYYGSGRYYSPPYRGYRPYSFRLQTRIRGFDVYIGYPVPYSYRYAYPVPIYGYGRPLRPVIVAPASPFYGGVSLELAPYDAEVFVDGAFAGWVEDFDGTLQPLTLRAGVHRIEVVAPGYESLVLDVLVRAGEVIPYRGSLVPYRD